MSSDLSPSISPAITLLPSPELALPTCTTYPHQQLTIYTGSDPLFFCLFVKVAVSYRLFLFCPCYLQLFFLLYLFGLPACYFGFVFLFELISLFWPLPASCFCKLSYFIWSINPWTLPAWLLVLRLGPIPVAPLKPAVTFTALVHSPCSHQCLFQSQQAAVFSKKGLINWLFTTCTVPN